MRHLKEIGLLLMIMWLIFPAYAGAEGLGNARLSLMEGDVQIKYEDSSDWMPASVNMPLREGDSIWVPDGSRAEIQVVSGSVVRMEENSALEILNLERDSSQFYLSTGRLYANFRGEKNRGVLQIDTPISSVRAYDRAIFGVDVFRGGDTDVMVYKGSVYAESRSGKTRVSSGKMLYISDYYADLMSLGGVDDWERWNVDRDRAYDEKRYSTRYLPSELEMYSSDFDNNGKWIYDREYGYVWTPTVFVSAGWSPYRHGRWSWIGGDYVWIGYEPWGWAPYHYGRWSFVVSIGWCWVPPVRGAVYWGPGYVGWVNTSTHVAWVPLAPGEIYYGHGNYGPNSVNLINVDINKVVVKNIYKNVYVNNSVTVQHHDTFVKGKHVDVNVKENLFLKEKIHIGRPQIKPERATMMPVVKEIPRAKEPPQKIREIKYKEIKESRPIVRERSGSTHITPFSGKQTPVDRPIVIQDRDNRSKEERKNSSGKTTKQEAEPPSRSQSQKQPERQIEKQPKDTGSSAKQPIELPAQSQSQKQPERQIEKQPKDTGSSAKQPIELPAQSQKQKQPEKQPKDSSSFREPATERPGQIKKQGQSEKQPNDTGSSSRPAIEQPAQSQKQKQPEKDILKREERNAERRQKLDDAARDRTNKKVSAPPADSPVPQKQQSDKQKQVKPQDADEQQQIPAQHRGGRGN